MQQHQLGNMEARHTTRTLGEALGTKIDEALRRFPSEADFVFDQPGALPSDADNFSWLFRNGFLWNTQVGGDSTHTMVGTEEDDLMLSGRGDTDLKGGAGDDVLISQSGSDLLEGGDDDDLLLAGAGDDTLFGGSGKDKMSGGSGNDSLYGGAGKDRLDGDAGNDNLYGEEGNDELSGHEGDDMMDGGNGKDLLFGGDGDDVLVGGLGDDVLVGGSGSDILNGGSGSNYLDGGLGRDTFVSSGQGLQVLLHFTRGEDCLQFKDVFDPAASTDERLARLEVVNAGRNTIVRLEGAGDPLHAIVLRDLDLTEGGQLSSVEILRNMLASGELLLT